MRRGKEVKEASSLLACSDEEERFGSKKGKEVSASGGGGGGDECVEEDPHAIYEDELPRSAILRHAFFEEEMSRPANLRRLKRGKRGKEVVKSIGKDDCASDSENDRARVAEPELCALTIEVELPESASGEKGRTMLRRESDWDSDYGSDDWDWGSDSTAVVAEQADVCDWEQEDYSSGSSVSDLYWPLEKVDFDLLDLLDGFLCVSISFREEREKQYRKEFQEAVRNPDLEESLSEDLKTMKEQTGLTDKTTIAHICRMENEGYLLSRDISSDSKLVQYVRRSEQDDPQKYPNVHVRRVFEAFYKKGWSFRCFPEFDFDDKEELYRRLELDVSSCMRYYDAIDSSFRYEISSSKGDKHYLSMYDDLSLIITADSTYEDAFNEASKLWERNPAMPAEMVEIVATDVLYECVVRDCYEKEWNHYFELWKQVVKNKVALLDAWPIVYGSEWDSDKLKEHLQNNKHRLEVSAILSIGDENPDEEAKLFVKRIVYYWHDLTQKNLYASYLRNKLTLAHTMGIVD